MEGKKKYFFTRNGETIGRGFDKQETALATAKQYQSYDHKIEGDFTMIKGERKPVVYKVEEREWKHFLPDGVGGNGYQRTFNDIILPDLCKPARLDAEGTAKPLTSIVAHVAPNKCFYGAKRIHDPQLRNNETGEEIPLYAKN